ncbi:MAG: hypothetical protein NUV63_05065 [Gallionella sp.]|nr:hypothetical protein [Gallionella sp.]
MLLSADVWEKQHVALNNQGDLMDALAFDATRFVRSALQSTVFYLSIIAILSMTMVKPAGASGFVLPSPPPANQAITCFTILLSEISVPDDSAKWITVFNVSSTFYDCSLGLPAKALEKVPVGWTVTNYPRDGNSTYTHVTQYSNPTYYNLRIYYDYHFRGVEDATGRIVEDVTGRIGAYFMGTSRLAATPKICPANSVGTPATNPTTCACNDPSVSDPINYVPDATGKSCVPAVTCPIDPLPKPPPPFPDACSNSLEKGRGTDVDNACAEGLTPDMERGASCVADKIKALAIPYTKPSGTIRTTAYQNHLLAVWNKSEEIKTKYKNLSDAQKQECAARITDVTNEMKHHGITSEPSKKEGDAPHVLGRAIDIPEAVAEALIAKVPTTTTVPMLPGCLSCSMTIPYGVEDYINSATVDPPACNLRWGGLFKKYDPVHFQLP